MQYHPTPWLPQVQNPKLLSFLSEPIIPHHWVLVKSPSSSCPPSHRLIIAQILLCAGIVARDRSFTWVEEQPLLLCAPWRPLEWFSGCFSQIGFAALFVCSTHM
jgi:hypothetical protein